MKISVTVYLTLDGRTRLNEVCTELAASTFDVARVGELTGIVSGYVDEAAVDYIRHIKGVKRVTHTRKLALPYV